MKANIDNEKWVRCARCGHKLFKVLNLEGIGKTVIEVKCHSCKELNVVCQNQPEADFRAFSQAGYNFIDENRKEA